MFSDISAIVKSRRKYLGMTQSQLAEGICRRETIARLESGKRKTDFFIANEVMHKLGLIMESGIEIPISRDCSTVRERNIELNQLSAVHDYRGCMEFVEKWKDHRLFRKGTYGYIIIKQAEITAYFHNGDPNGPDRTYAIIYEILNILRPGFQLEKIGDYYLSQLETATLQNLSVHYALHKNDWNKGIELLEKVTKALEVKYVKITGFGKWYYRNMLGFLCMFYLQAGRFQDALETAENCIGFFFDGYLATVSPAPCFYRGMCVKAASLIKLGRKEEGEEQYKKFLMLSYVLDGFLGESFDAHVKAAEEVLGSPIDLSIPWGHRK